MHCCFTLQFTAQCYKYLTVPSQKKPFNLDQEVDHQCHPEKGMLVAGKIHLLENVLEYLA